MEKQTFQGAILIFSCHKHLETRLKEFAMKRGEYVGWKVFYVLGNPLLESDFVLQGGNTVILKCEDSYIHLAKKVALGVQCILDHFTVVEGILRCGDDLVFDEDELVSFLNCPNKPDYLGVPVERTKDTVRAMDAFMPTYYANHTEDFENPLHGLAGISLADLRRCRNTFPDLLYAGGVVVFLSVMSCRCLVAHFASIGWNIFAKHDRYGHVYIVEDFAVGFVLHQNRIPLVRCKLYSDSSAELSIAFHTNKYK